MVGKQRNPYVGPRTFEEQDREFFFGRDQEASALLSLVLAHRLVLFHATSGAGKSSLINTCLIPALRDEQFTPMIGRVSSGHKIAKVSSAANPYMANLLSNLSTAENPGDLSHLTLSDFLGEHYILPASDEDAFVEPARILIIDQFEELFTTNQAFWRKREDFFSQIDAAMAQDPLLWVLFVMREDYITSLDRFAHLLPGKLRVRFHMERMREQAATLAITQPAALANRPFEPGSGFLPGPAEMLLRDLRQIRVSGSAATVTGEFIEPVQLQLVCYSLWQELRSKPGNSISNNDIQALADVDKTLGDYYDGAVAKTVAQTGIEEDVLRKWVGQEFITEGNTRGLVFRGKTSSEGMVNQVVDYLDDQFFLLRSSTIGGGTWYELVHDRFIPAIRLSNLAARERLEAEQRQLALLAQKIQEDDKWRRRILFRIIPATVILTFVALIIFGVQERSRATAVITAATANANQMTADSALVVVATEKAEAVDGQMAAATVAVANQQTADAANAIAATEANAAATIAGERDDLLVQQVSSLEQQQQSINQQSTRVVQAQYTRTANLGTPVAGNGSLLTVAEATSIAMNATSVAVQLQVAVASQTSIAADNLTRAYEATLTVQAEPQQKIIGYSWKEQPIEVVQFGHGPKNIVLVGGIHSGASPNTVQFIDEAVTWFSENPESLPESISLFLVPNMNPDAVYAPGELEGRFNANGVDLNRNWDDCYWTEDPKIRGEIQEGTGGNKPFSEAETRIMYDLFRELKPEAVIFWGGIARNGQSIPGGCPKIDDVSDKLAAIFGDASGFTYMDIENNITEGDVTNWLPQQGSPAIFILMPDVWRTHFDENIKGVEAVVRYIAEN